ncbi:uncharacterized protein LOC100906880 [Galendromus occidentalis]|uniref:Uncharacterized protein LOC100906880 n=1 Tax=Galendromus occidentalis TaxID=34638 RepID=A0AAJ6VXC8_9ACAR|nr:uncharacterized protein LOC100906880 [Galendromus occidentalis]
MKFLLLSTFTLLAVTGSPAAERHSESDVRTRTQTSKAPTGESPVPPVVVPESDVEIDDSLQARQQLLDPCEQGQGVCMSGLDCSFQRGNNIGNCDGGGVCCHIAKTCEKGREIEITTNNTYFVEPQNIWDPEGPVHCGISVRKISGFGTQICQMRLDFVNFNTVGPDPRTGDCRYDMLTIEQGDANARIHKICGLNDGQHVYVDVKHTDSIKLRMNIDYSKDPNRLRKWNIRITQLPCRSPRLAPPGCLQYYEDYSGTIKSFNYGPIGVNETSYPLGVRYSMCFKRGPEACRIYLKKAGPFGLGEVPREEQTRTDALNEIDQQCFDRLQVSRTSVSKAFIAIDHTKFCGNTFQDEYRTENNGVNVISFVSPAYEAIRDEEGSRQPPGFKFFYRLLACGTS